MCLSWSSLRLSNAALCLSSPPLFGAVLCHCGTELFRRVTTQFFAYTLPLLSIPTLCFVAPFLSNTVPRRTLPWLRSATPFRSKSGQICATPLLRVTSPFFAVAIQVCASPRSSVACHSLAFLRRRASFLCLSMPALSFAIPKHIWSKQCPHLALQR